MRGFWDTGLRSTKRAVATAVIDPDILLALTFFLLWVIFTWERQDEGKICTLCCSEDSSHGYPWSSLWSYAMMRRAGTPFSTASNYHFFSFRYLIYKQRTPTVLSVTLPIPEDFEVSYLYPERDTTSILHLWKGFENTVEEWEPW